MTIGKRTFAVLAGGLLIALVFGVAYGLPRTSQDPAAGKPDQVIVRRGTLVATVSATGAISPRRQAEMAFTASGPVTLLSVTQGDTVKSGQMLAQLDTRALEFQVAQADANLAAAQAKLDQLNHPSAADVTSAQSAVASAQAALAQLKLPAQNDITVAKSDADKAKAALDRAQADYDRAGGASNPFIAMTQQSMTLQQASTDYQKAVAVYNSKINPTDSQLKQAQSTLDQALAQLAKLTDPSPNDLQAAQANVDQTRAARDMATAQLDNAILRAPFDGIVTHVDLDLGSFAAAGRTILGVADTTEQLVKVNIDETDIARVKTGQDVTIGLDAYPDVTLTGKVTDVAAAATTTQGVVNYVVTVTLKPGDVPIKMGMTANANIVVAQKDNVLLVPNSAIRAVNSRRLVTVLDKEGKSSEVEIKLGAANDQETEVVDGLSEGQTVLISTTPLNSVASPFGGSSK